MICWIGVGIAGAIEPLKCERFGDQNTEFMEQCGETKNLSDTHQSIGHVILWIFHLCALTGFIRPSSDMSRNAMIAVHNILGYGILLFSGK